MTFTVPQADKVIAELAATYTADQIILGAGTVLDPETARIAILNGAQFIVSPYFSCRNGKALQPLPRTVYAGYYDHREAIKRWRPAQTFLKLFPGDVMGPKMIKAIRGPLPYVKIMPTGGVDADNVGEWIKAGAVAVGAGSCLTAGAKTGDYESITKIGQKFIENIKAALRVIAAAFVQDKKTKIGRIQTQ